MPSFYFLLSSAIILSAVSYSSDARPIQQASSNDWFSHGLSSFIRPFAETEQAQFEQGLRDLINAFQGQWPLKDQESKKTTEQSVGGDFGPLQKLMRGQWPLEDQELKKSTQQSLQVDFGPLQELLNQLTPTPSAKQQVDESLNQLVSGLMRTFGGDRGETQSEKDKASEEGFLKIKPFQGRRKTAPVAKDAAQKELKNRMNEAMQQFFTNLNIPNFNNWPWVSLGTQSPPTTTTDTPFNTYDYMYEELANELRALEDE